MTGTLALANVVSFALQVAVLVAAGALLARAFRIDEPRPALAYWRTLLALCLALPFCQQWQTVIPAAIGPAPPMTAATDAVAAAVVTAPAAATAWPVGTLVLVLLASGTGARILWLAIGGYGLRRLRRQAVPLEPLPSSMRRAQERTATEAVIVMSDRVSGPLTFGWLRPVIVIPPSVVALPADIQEAIACHELLHVRRRDWLHEVLEEIIRAVLWFHPAVWWLIGRIRLTREQVVDQAAVELTESRERYVEALLAVATARSPLALAPVSPFFRRRLLARRVARILEATTMTTRRLIASFTSSAAVLGAATIFAVRLFPLEAQGQAAIGTGPVQIVKGGDHLLHGEIPEYPRRAIEQHVEGDVLLELAVDERGEVADARVLSGPDELRKATLETVLQWHYAPSAVSSVSTQAIIRFHLPPPGTAKAGFEGRDYVVRSDRGTLEAKIRAEGEKTGWAVMSDEARKRTVDEMKAAIASPETSPEQREELKRKVEAFVSMKDKMARADLAEVKPDGKSPGTSRLAQFRIERVSEETAREVFAQAGVKVGDPITEQVARRISEAAARVDEHLRVEYQPDGRGNVTIVLLTR